MLDCFLKHQSRVQKVVRINKSAKIVSDTITPLPSFPVLFVTMKSFLLNLSFCGVLWTAQDQVERWISVKLNTRISTCSYRNFEEFPVCWSY